MQTTIADLLNNYEGMKDTLISINPKFKKLNNPVLRRTLAKVATVKQAAIVGGMEPLELLNRLRESVGEAPINSDGSILVQDSLKEEPSWIKKEPKITLDANTLLDENKNPLAEANRALKGLKEDESIVINSDFRPEPLIEALEKTRYSIYCKEIGDSQFLTYIKK